MRVDVNGVGIEYEVTGEGPPVVLLHGFPDSGPAVAPPGARPRRGRVSTDRPRPAGLRRLGPSPRRSRPTRSRYLAGDVVGRPRPAGRRPRPCRGPRLGRGAGLGHRVARCPTGSTTWWRCRSATRRRSCRPGSSSGRSRGTCCCSSSRASPSSGCPNDDWANFRSWGGHPDIDGVIADLERTRIAHARGSTGTGPTCRPRLSSSPALGAAGGAGHHHGGVGQRRLRPHRGADDRIGRATWRDRGATKRIEGPGPLDAARGTRRGERVAARLPARLTGGRRTAPRSVAEFGGPASPGGRGRPLRSSAVVSRTKSWAWPSWSMWPWRLPASKLSQSSRLVSSIPGRL